MKAKFKRGLSLGGRIVLINVVAMLLVIAGLFYFGHYMDRLVGHEVETLFKQANLVSSTLGEIAVTNTEEGDTLDAGPTQQIVRRMIENNDVRTQVFTPSLVMAADSRMLKGAGRFVQIETLAAPNRKGTDFGSLIDRALNWIAMAVPLRQHLSKYPTNGTLTAAEMPDLAPALRGERHFTLWTDDDHNLILTVAVPVQRLQQVVGAVALTRGSAEIANAVRELRVDILQSFAVVLGMSVALSFYLAQTIAWPLRRLSRAALSARAITSGPPQIPDFSNRTDEIGDLSIAVRDMTAALWQRLDAIERFAADVSHEIKNPLTSMKSALETLTRVSDPVQKEKLLAILSNDVQRMDRLIRDISHVSRLDAELSRSGSEEINLVEMLSALATSRNQVAAGGPTIDLKAEAARVAVRAVPSRLVQVFENLIGNALSFSSAGEQVTVRVEALGTHAVVTVEDQGPGIPADKIEKIFDRFYSARPAGETFGTHSGLGLSISRQIVEGHGGRIYAQNRPSRGARFTVELPLFN